MMAGVYLIWQEGTDLYKIGMTNGDPASRLSQLQSGNPSKLELLCFLEHSSPNDKECELHERWAKYRIQGEWFKVHPTALNELFGSFGSHFQDPIFMQAGAKLGGVILREFHDGVKKTVETTALSLLEAINDDDTIWRHPILNKQLDSVAFEMAARRVICDLYEEIEKRKSARAEFDKKFQARGAQ